MGWARTNEFARLYRVNGEVRLYMEPQDGSRHWIAAVPFRADEWTVRRGRSSGDDGYAQVVWTGYIQATMGSWTTLCFKGASVKATEATDQQILNAYFCDQHIYDTGPAPTMPQDGDGTMVYVKTQCPVTYGGTAKRLAFMDLGSKDQDRVKGHLEGIGLNVKECRGLHRTEAR